MNTSSTPRGPRRIMARALGFGIGSLVVASLLTWTPAAVSGWNQGSAESTLWQLLNGARSNNGMAPLQQHGTLVGLARWRSADMLAKDYFSHTIAGCGCLVYAYYDSNGLNYVWGGENIGWNSGLDDSYSPVRVHEAFMNSSGHRANVLNRSFTHGGVGAAAADNQQFQGYVQNTRMYTELFMQAPSGPAPAPAAPAPAPAAQQPSSGSGATAAPTGGGQGRSGGQGRCGGQGRSGGTGRTPKPQPALVTMAAPTRPTSTAGIDGRSTVVSTPAAADLAVRLRADEIAAIRISAQPTPERTIAEPVNAQMEVAAAPKAEANLIEGIVGALLGFLFG